jgi:hypothetical protein
MGTVIFYIFCIVVFSIGPVGPGPPRDWPGQRRCDTGGQDESSPDPAAGRPRPGTSLCWESHDGAQAPGKSADRAPRHDRRGPELADGRGHRGQRRASGQDDSSDPKPRAASGRRASEHRGAASRWSTAAESSPAAGAPQGKLTRPFRYAIVFTGTRRRSHSGPVVNRPVFATL